MTSPMAGLGRAVHDHRMTSGTFIRRRDPKLVALASIPRFSAWRQASIKALGAICDLVELAPGASIHRQGDPLRHWVQVVDGLAVRVRDGVPAGVVGAEGSWGEALATLPGRHPSPEGLFALGPATVLVVEGSPWRAMAGEAPPTEPSRAVPERPQWGGGAWPRKKRSNSPSTPAPWSVMPPSTTTV